MYANAVSDCVAVSYGPVEILAKLNDGETPNYCQSLGLRLPSP